MPAVIHIIVIQVLCVLASLCPTEQPVVDPEPTVVIEDAEPAFAFDSPVDYSPMRVTSGFHDWRPDGPHQALDIGCKERGCQSGMPKILAVAAGTVSTVGWDGDGYGHWIEIDHGNGTRTRYAHLAAKPPFVKGVGVASGQELGVMGKSGRATGVHLHFEILENGVRIDPESVLCEKITECVRG